MTENEMQKICSELKSIVLKPVCFNDIEIELLDVKRAKHTPNRHFRAHHHPWFEFNCFSGGTFKTTMQGTSFVSSSGDSILIPPGTTHSHVSGKDGDDGICMRWQISAKKVGEISPEAADFISCLNTPHAENLNADTDILLRLGECSYLNQSVFLCFILSIYNNWRTVSEVRSIKNTVSNQAILYLEEYCQNPITALDVSNALNMSYRNLSRIFKKETGVTIVEKLNEIRIAKSRRLLLETDMSVSKIAEAVGFMNVYYFSNIFKKYTLMSPKSFRNKNSEAK